MPGLTFLRYPGSKAKLVDAIRATAAPLSVWRDAGLRHGERGRTYCEPFVGGGAVLNATLPVLRRDTRVVLNDKDAGIAALWQAVLTSPDALCERIAGYVPKAEDFHRFKAEDGDAGIEPIEAAFRKLAVHQMSFSGLGVMAGGPLSVIGSRWNARELVERVKWLHRSLSRLATVDVLCGDFEAALTGLPSSAFAYLDPPYYAKGAELYKHAMSDADHARLATILRAADWSWVLSYDDHPRIRDLYSWATVATIPVTYCGARVTAASRPQTREVVIVRAERAAEAVQELAYVRPEHARRKRRKPAPTVQAATQRELFL